MALHALWGIEPSSYKPEHYLLLLVAFLGVTGNLPTAIMLGRLSAK